MFSTKNHFFIDEMNEKALQEDNQDSFIHQSEKIASIYLKFVSSIVLVFTCLIWAWIVGFDGNDLQKIYTVAPLQGGIYVVLAVGLPVLAVGLWLEASWGVILWAMMAGGLVFSHLMILSLQWELLVFTIISSVLLFTYCIGISIQAWIAYKRFS